MDPILFEAIKQKYKPKGNDVSLDYARANYKYLMLKMDGWWSVAECKDGTATIYSVSMEPMYSISIPTDMNGIFVGEWLFGTNRALSNPATYQTFCPFDMVDNSKTYLQRYGAMRKWMNEFDARVRAKGSFFNPVDIYDIAFLDYFLDYIKRNNMEGLVFRNDDDQPHLSRYKPKFTQDYVCMGYLEGNGKYTGLLGAVIGGKYINGKLTKVISVGGGFTDAMRIEFWKQNNVGRVFEAEGRQLFDSGALRHPTFLRWREDKTAEECIWPLKLT